MLTVVVRSFESRPGAIPDRVHLPTRIVSYLSAKLFASWAAYQGDGTVAVLELVAVAESTLKTEVSRQCATTGRALDADLLKAAIRQCDLLLVHRADSRLLSAPES